VTTSAERRRGPLRPKVCLICGVSFLGSANRSYCSSKCCGIASSRRDVIRSKIDKGMPASAVERFLAKVVEMENEPAYIRHPVEEPAR
jgi:hypothetical protein